MVGCLLTTFPASAADTGSIGGVVTGPGGVPLAGVEVDVYLQPGNIASGAGTDATGAYVLPNLPAGDYKVLFGYANANSPYAQEWYDDAPDEAAADLVPSRRSVRIMSDDHHQGGHVGGDDLAGGIVARDAGYAGCHCAGDESGDYKYEDGGHSIGR